MKPQQSYRDLAIYYDLIYSWKDYKKEAETIDKLIKKYNTSKGKELLEVACGTGKHLNHLNKKYHCTGIDYSKGMLSVAKKQLKKVTLKQANMINFNLQKKYDIITCLFSSIGYVKTYRNLKKTINTFARHLKPGGIIIIEPWFTNETFYAGRPHIDVAQNDKIKVARAVVSQVKGNISSMDMHYLIAEKNKTV